MKHWSFPYHTRFFQFHNKITPSQSLSLGKNSNDLISQKYRCFFSPFWRRSRIFVMLYEFMILGFVEKLPFIQISAFNNKWRLPSRICLPQKVFASSILFPRKHSVEAFSSFSRLTGKVGSETFKTGLFLGKRFSISCQIYKHFSKDKVYLYVSWKFPFIQYSGSLFLEDLLLKYGKYTLTSKKLPTKQSVK